jgi:outer membrane receptor protein involved in Fe transport
MSFALHRTWRTSRLLPLALAIAAPVSFAQDSDEVVLEEIVVTAQKREESLQDVPISVNAISGEKLAEAGIARLDDLKAYVPNLQVTETGIANNFYIRGIGSGLNQGFEQSVSTYSDGVFRGRGPQSRMPFLDLERIEVLRGPQPVLFGKNAIAGAVNLISARPTDEFMGSVRATYEIETNETAIETVLSVPFTETFGARLALRYRENDGYVQNLTLNGDEPSREDTFGRLTFAFTPSENFDATLKIEHGRFDIVGRQVEIFGELPAAPIRRPNGTTLTPPIPGLTYAQILRGPFGALTSPGAANNVIDYQRSSNGDYSIMEPTEAALTLNWRFANGVTLTSVTGFSEYSLDEGCDCDFTGANTFTAGIFEEYDQFSQELRLTSDKDQTVSWIAGAFLQNYSLDESDFIFIPSNSLIGPLLNGNPALPMGSGSAFLNTRNPRVFKQDSDMFAVFGQATWNVSDAFRVTAGGRWSTESKSGSRVTRLTTAGGVDLPAGAIDVLYNAVFRIQRHSVRGERTEDNFSPLVNVQYDFGNDSMAYLSWSKGFKSGGFDARSNQAPPTGTFEYEPEEAKSWEAGVKTRLGNAAEVNASVFFTDYEDLQTSAFDGSLGFNVGNGSAEVKGVELEGRWQATQGLFLSGSVAWLDFEWTKYDGQCYFNPPAALLSTRVPGNCNYDGFTNQLAPEITAVLSAEYTWQLGDLELRTGLDATFSDDYLISLTLDPNAKQKAYTKLNARVALAGAEKKWELALVARNLTDETVLSYAGDAPLAGSIFGARSYYGFIDPPRTVALEGSFRF